MEQITELPFLTRKKIEELKCLTNIWFLLYNVLIRLGKTRNERVFS